MLVKKETFMVFKLILILNILFLVGCDKSSNNIPSPNTQTKVKNIILIIGDGMGTEHIKAARWKKGGINGSLHRDELLANGMIKTSSLNNIPPDSAAAGTAMSTGVKTVNGIIGMDQNLNELKTILELAKENSKSVGLVSNTQLSHATPASFASHEASRNDVTNIALDIAENNVDVLLGGGEDDFLPNTINGCFDEPGERVDGRNLIDELIDKGYTYVCSDEVLNSVDIETTKKLIGLFSDEGLIRPFSPTLSQMTQKSLDILSKNDNGFFLMIEAGQIDWASHSNDAFNVIEDTIDLDNTIGLVNAFVKNRNDTLVIFTSDHETGGMTVSLEPTNNESEDGPFTMPDGTPFYVNWTTTGHTGSDVPIRASGFNSTMFNGTNENTYIYNVMKESFGF